MPIRVATFNIRGFESACDKGLGDWIRLNHPDPLCLQELNAPHDEVRAFFRELGYGVRLGSYGSKNLAIAYKYVPCREVELHGDDVHTLHDHWLMVEYEKYRVASIYLPYDEQLRNRYLSVLARKMNSVVDKPCIVAGDFNVRRSDLNPSALRAFGPGQSMSLIPGAGGISSPAERFAEEIKPSWVDVCLLVKQTNPNQIDYQFATTNLSDRINSVRIDKASNISDHDPIIVDYWI